MSFFDVCKKINGRYKKAAKPKAMTTRINVMAVMAPAQPPMSSSFFVDATINMVKIATAKLMRNLVIMLFGIPCPESEIVEFASCGAVSFWF